MKTKEFILETIESDLLNAITDSMEEDEPGELRALSNFIYKKIAPNLDAFLSDLETSIESMQTTIDDNEEILEDKISEYIDIINELETELQFYKDECYNLQIGKTF